MKTPLIPEIFKTLKEMKNDKGELHLNAEQSAKLIVGVQIATEILNDLIILTAAANAEREKNGTHRF